MLIARARSCTQVEKILIMIALAFVTLALLVIALSSPVTGYETSIYDAYPLYFWFFLTAAIACGVIILLHQAFTEKKSRWWTAGFAIVIFVNSIFLLLPKFRGYPLYGRGDTLTHLGHMKDIMTTGHVGESNFYPIEHILGGVMIQILGLPLEDIPYTFFVLFSAIYIVNMYLLARSASIHSGQVLFIVALSAPLVYSFFHASIHPSFVSLYFVPLLIHFYQKREWFPYAQGRNTAILLLLAFFVTFSHPIIALFSIAIFLIFGLTSFRRKIAELSEYRVGSRNFLGVTLIMLMIFSMWYLSYASIQRSFKRVFDWLVYQIGTSLYSGMMEDVAEAGLTPVQTFELFVYRYGAIFLLLLTSGIACIYVLSKSLSKKHSVEHTMFIYSFQFVIALFIGAVMLFGRFHEYNPVRVSRFALLMGTIVSGLVGYEIIKSRLKSKVSKRKTLPRRLTVIILMAMLIMAIVMLSMGSTYGSPRTYRISQQVTQTEIAGTEWFGRLRDSKIAVVTNLVRIDRFDSYNFGIESSNIPQVKFDRKRLPSHFGYDKYDTISEALDFKDRYVIIFPRDMLDPSSFMGEVRPTVHQYTEDDFVKLSFDPTASKLYCNGEFEVWRVYSRGY